MFYEINNQYKQKVDISENVYNFNVYECIELIVMSNVCFFCLIVVLWFYLNEVERD